MVVGSEMFGEALSLSLLVYIVATRAYSGGLGSHCSSETGARDGTGKNQLLLVGIDA